MSSYGASGWLGTLLVMAHSMGTGTIAFGLVSIPIRVYSAHVDQKVHFNQLHAACGKRITTQMFCPVDSEVVEHKDMVRGYEHTKDQYVLFTEDELRSLKGKRSTAIELEEFVPAGSIDPAYIEDTWWLGPDEGGGKAYHLLIDAMLRTKSVAIARYAPREREDLVVVAPYGTRGLQLHRLWYANEVRDFSDVWTDTTGARAVSEEEFQSAMSLVEQMSSDRFDPTPFSDGYVGRVRAAIDAKADGQEVKQAVESPPGKILDLLKALQQSVAAAKEKSSAKLPPAPPSSKAPPSAGPGPTKAAAPEAKKKRRSGT